MKLALLRLFLFLTVCLLLAPAAFSQPYPPNCSAWTNAASQVLVMNRPDGTGDSLSAAQLFMGGVMDATITVELLDVLGDPVQNYPAANIELGTVGGNGTFNPCLLGAIADAASDDFGLVTFSGQLAAGGHSTGDLVVVFVDGSPLDWNPLDILFQSADMNGNLIMDSADTDSLAADIGSSAFKSDFIWNGLVGLEDIDRFTSHFFSDTGCAVTSLLEIDVTPDGEDISWTLEGPSGFFQTGSEDIALPGLEPGTYTLTWDPINCFATPSPNPDVQELLPNDNLVFEGDYVPYGTVFIDPNPDGDPDLTVHWKLYGSAPFDTLFGSGNFNICLPHDDYTIAWGEEPGWYHDCTNPETQALFSEGAISFTCLYHEYATIDVDPNPDLAPVTWTLDGPNAYHLDGAGDQTVTDLRPGTYTLDWIDGEFWYNPCTDPETIIVGEGGFYLASCTFLEMGTVGVLTLPHNDLPWSMTGPYGFEASGIGNTEYFPVPPGGYEITWLPYPCFTEPEENPEAFVLIEGGSIEVLGVYAENGTITIDAEPEAISAPWHLVGPGEYDLYGAGDLILTCMSPGDYTLTWLPVPEWILSCPDPILQALPEAGTINFTCTYGEAGTVVINPDPDSLNAPWHLLGPASFDTTGTGDARLLLKPAGSYTLTWGDLPYWVEPMPNPNTMVLATGDSIVYNGLFETLPEILSIVDVDGDQGRHVRLVWRRCLFDAPDDTVEISGYGIYRRQDAFKGLTAPTGPREPDALKMLGWDVLGMVPARMDSAYQYVAETLCDSTDSGGMCWSVFMISAITPSAAVFFDSRPDSGYSLDNLAPNAPTGLAVDYVASGTTLSWDPNYETDLRFYRVYRADLNSGEPGDCGDRPVEVEAEVATEFWTDPEGGWGSCYYVTAVDHAGNEGPASNWFDASVTGVPGEGLPSAVALYHNVPNPFNPMTTISYDLPTISAVRLGIYDVSGRLIRQLVNESAKEPGHHQVIWTGGDQRGQRVAAGVYFYRLETEDFQATRSMVLLK